MSSRTIYLPEKLLRAITLGIIVDSDNRHALDWLLDKGKGMVSEAIRDIFLYSYTKKVTVTSDLINQEVSVLTSLGMLDEGDTITVDRYKLLLGNDNTPTSYPYSIDEFYLDHMYRSEELSKHGVQVVEDSITILLNIVSIIERYILEGIDYYYTDTSYSDHMTLSLGIRPDGLYITSILHRE